eukprot:TRINITY_DN513_c0_g1_i1.p1 TRINITY_DN513_c0_g1~~TRINITY_DN513_c0_g1_i1.p1  ORF type:complete len:1038 (+),score=406.69 TRINITY_DN513_c0_g1_i1:116-3229(+)
MGQVPSWVWGVTLSFGGCTMSNVGINVQKLSHTRKQQLVNEGNEKGNQSVYRSPLWILGFLLAVVGSICDLVSFGFADMSLLAPLGAMTLVVNMVVAPCFLNEKLTRRDIVNTIVILAGTILSITFGNKSSTSYTLTELIDFYSNPPFIVYMICIGAIYVLNYVTLKVMGKREAAGIARPLDLRYQAFAYPALAGSMGAHSVLCAKSAAEVIKQTSRGENQFVHAASYFMIGGLALSLFFQMKLLNDGLSKADALYIVPVYQVSWVVMNTIVGLIYFQDYNTMGMLHVAMFVLGILIAVFGVYLLSNRTLSQGETTLSTKYMLAPVATSGVTTRRSMSFSYGSGYSDNEQESGVTGGIGGGGGGEQDDNRHLLAYHSVHGPNVSMQSILNPSSSSSVTSSSSSSEDVTATRKRRKNKKNGGGRHRHVNAAAATNEAQSNDYRQQIDDDDIDDIEEEDDEDNDEEKKKKQAEEIVGEDRKGHTKPLLDLHESDVDDYDEKNTKQSGRRGRPPQGIDTNFANSFSSTSTTTTTTTTQQPQPQPQLTTLACSPNSPTTMTTDETFPSLESGGRTPLPMKILPKEDHQAKSCVNTTALSTSYCYGNYSSGSPDLLALERFFQSTPSADASSTITNMGTGSLGSINNTHSLQQTVISSASYKPARELQRRRLPQQQQQRHTTRTKSPAGTLLNERRGGGANYGAGPRVRRNKRRVGRPRADSAPDSLPSLGGGSGGSFSRAASAANNSVVIDIAAAKRKNELNNINSSLVIKSTTLPSSSSSSTSTITTQQQQQQEAERTRKLKEMMRSLDPVPRRPKPADAFVPSSPYSSSSSSYSSSSRSLMALFSTTASSTLSNVNLAISSSFSSSPSASSAATSAASCLDSFLLPLSSSTSSSAPSSSFSSSSSSTSSSIAVVLPSVVSSSSSSPQMNDSSSPSSSSLLFSSESVATATATSASSSSSVSSLSLSLTPVSSSSPSPSSPSASFSAAASSSVTSSSSSSFDPLAAMALASLNNLTSTSSPSTSSSVGSPRANTNNNNSS